jgi:hypothetical protein
MKLDAVTHLGAFSLGARSGDRELVLELVQERMGGFLARGWHPNRIFKPG